MAFSLGGLGALAGGIGGGVELGEDIQSKRLQRAAQDALGRAFSQPSPMSGLAGLGGQQPSQPQKMAPGQPSQPMQQPPFGTTPSVPQQPPPAPTTSPAGGGNPMLAKIAYIQQAARARGIDPAIALESEAQSGRACRRCWRWRIIRRPVSIAHGRYRSWRQFGARPGRRLSTCDRARPARPEELAEDGGLRTRQGQERRVVAVPRRGACRRSTAARDWRRAAASDAGARRSSPPRATAAGRKFSRPEPDYAVGPALERQANPTTSSPAFFGRHWPRPHR